MLDILERQMDKIFLNDDISINFSSITDMIIHRFFSDLEAYYRMPEKGSRMHPVKDTIQARLKKKLRKYRRKEIMLIGHSMGSIIAFDVLHENPSLHIHTLITIGSPLGIPIIISKISAEQQKASKRIRIPEGVIKNWYNFSDLEDKVAFNYNLADDYAENSKHVKVTDKIVNNNYEIRGERNPHKSYGYLRTPEITEVIASFLGKKTTKHSSFIRRFLNYPTGLSRKSEK